MKWKNLTMPKQVVPDAGNNDGYGKFVIEPLERGFGVTLGNALRRVLLSSLQGAAITAVRIDGVLHEFSTLPGVIEDVTEIILNLKQVRLKLHGDGPKKGTFEMRGKGEVRAGDLQVDPEVEILNPDLHIATLNQDGDLRMEVEIDGGRGYVSADQHSQTDRPIGVIPIDSLFSPVHQGELQRRGHAPRTAHRLRQAHDRGVDRRSILPSDAVAVAAKILRDHFNLFIHFEEPIEEEVEEEVDEELDADPPAARQERRGAGALGALEQLPARRRDQDRSATWSRRASRRCSSTATSAASRSRRSRTSSARWACRFGMDVSRYFENKTPATVES